MNPAATIQARRMREAVQHRRHVEALEAVGELHAAAKRRLRWATAGAASVALALAGTVWGALTGWLPGRLAAFAH